MYILGEDIYFPPVETADDEGIVAMGGDLSIERLVLAYQSGIFPWYNDDEPIIWHSPDPRFVLFPEKLRISKSMKSLLSKHTYSFSINKDFKQVIAACKNISRDGQEGTWITNEMEAAYIELHKKGFAMSAEAWDDTGKLAGGLYGVKMGNVFCGESMFSHQSNASKFAFIHLVKELEQSGCTLVDCQVYTAHVESLGAEMISRKEYIQMLTNKTA